ncbi:hypothetical protein E3P78_00160 [Wallemia ichthyophaga]|nr:hypothetical protein E3P78_00160 [Wallemia ichthyophaga]
MKLKVKNQIPTGYRRPTAAFTPTEAPPSPTSNPPSLDELSEDDLIPLPPTPRHMRRKQVIDDTQKPEQVQVFVRMRPNEVNPVALSPNHINANVHKKHHLYDINKPTNTIALSANHPLVEKRSAGTPTRHSKNSEFTYDSLLLPPARTCSLYDSHITRLIHSSMVGYNSTVFAYGQTGSGKTHTLTGTEDEPGIIPLAVEQVFEEIYDDPSREFLLRVRYLEIYNEKLRDLLGPSTQNEELRVRENQGGNTFVENLTEVLVTTPQEVLALKDQGDLNRHVGATDWNDRSSRSHCVFQIVVESSERQSNLTKNSISRKSTLNLIDLAGSEKATTDSSRRLEGSNINKSLLALSTVISEIVKTPKPAHIPFRNSKLTYLLKPSLSGDARVGVVCTIADGMDHHNATLDTLKFARTIKKVKIQAKRGDILDGTKDALLQQHITQIKILQKEVAELESNKYEEIRHAIAEERAANDEKVSYQNEQIDQLNKDLGEARKLVLNSTNIDSEDMSSRRQSHLKHGQSRRLSDMGLGVSAPGFNIPMNKRRVLSTGIPDSTDESGDQDSRMREKDDEIDSLKLQLQEVRSEQAETSSRIEDLEVQLKAKGELDSVEENKGELSEEISRVKDENENLNKQLSDTLEQLRKLLISQKEQTENDISNSQEIEDLKSEFSNLQSARQDDELRLSSLQSQNDLLQDDFKSADERKNVAENELKEIEKERDEVNGRISTLEAAFTEKESRLKEMLKENENMVSDKNLVTRDRDDLLGKVENYENDMKDIRSQLQSAEDKYSQVTSERNGFKEEVEKAIAAQKLSQEVQLAAEKERDELNGRLSVLESESQEKENRLEEMLKEGENLKSEKEKAAGERDGLLAKLETYEKDLNNFKTQIQAAENKYNDATKECNGFKEELEMSVAAQKVSQDARLSAEKDLDELKEESSKVANALETAENSLKFAINAQKTAEIDRDTHKDKHASTKSALETLQSTHNTLQTNHDQLKAEKEDKTSRLENTYKELQQSHNTLKDGMQGEIENHKLEIDKLVKDADKFKKDNKEGEDEREQLKADLKNVTKEAEERKKSSEEREQEHTSLKAQVSEMLAEKESLNRDIKSQHIDNKRVVEEAEANHQESLNKVQEELALATVQLTTVREAQESAKKNSEAEMAALINSRAEEDVEFQERLGTAEKESSDALGMATKLTSTLVEKDSIIKELETKIEEYIERQNSQDDNEGFGQVHIAKRMEEYVELQDRVSELNTVIQRQASELSKLKARPLPQPTQSSHASSRMSFESGAARKLFDRASSPNLRAQSTPLTKTDDKEIDKLNDVVRLQRSTITDLRKDILNWRDDKDKYDENRSPSPYLSRPASSIDQPTTPVRRGHSRAASMITPSRSRPTDSLSRKNSVKETPEPLPAYDGLKSNSSVRRGPRKTLEHEIKNLQSANIVEKSKKAMASTNSTHSLDVGSCKPLLRSLKTQINNFKNGISVPQPVDHPMHTPPSLEGLQIVDHTFTITSEPEDNSRPSWFSNSINNLKQSLPKPYNESHTIEFGKVQLQASAQYKGTYFMPPRVRIPGKFTDVADGFIASLPNKVPNEEKEWLKANGFGYIKSDEDTSIFKRVNGWVNAAVAVGTLSQNQSVANVLPTAKLITCPTSSDNAEDVEFQIIITLKVFLKQKLIQEAPNDSLKLLLMRYKPPLVPKPTTPIRLSTQFFYSILQPATPIANTVSTSYLKTPLKDFQKSSIKFMQGREDNPDNIIEPGWIQLTDEWQYSAISAQFRQNNQPPKTSINGSMLCEEMGLGKTVEILGLIAQNKERAQEWSNQETESYQRFVKTSLIVTPDHLLQQWVDEAREHTPDLKLLVYNGYKSMDALLTSARIANTVAKGEPGEPEELEGKPLSASPPPQTQVKQEEDIEPPPTKKKVKKQDDDDFVPQFSIQQLELFNSSGSKSQRDFLADGTRVNLTGGTKRKAPQPKYTFDSFGSLKECKQHGLEYVDNFPQLFSFMNNHDNFDYESKSVLTNRSIVQDFFNQFDLILSTYSTFSKDLVVAHERQPRARRNGVEYKNDYIPMSPLVSCTFYRVAQDEIQLSGVKKSAEMTALIPRQTSVACSGTPITGSIEQLLPILRYLGFQLDGRLIDKKTFAAFATHGLSHDFTRLIQSICVRTTKDHVKKQLQIPPLQRYIVPLNMGAAEQAYIDEQYKQALSEIGLNERGDYLDANDPSFDISKLRVWITKLRQLTTHPQTHSATKDIIGKTFRTVDQVLDRMIESSYSHIVTEQRSALASSVKVARLRLLLDPPNRDGAKLLLMTVLSEANQVLENAQEQIHQHRVKKPKDVVEDIVEHTGAVIAFKEKSNDVVETAEEAQSRKDWQSHLSNLLNRHRDMLLVIHQAHLILGDIGHQQQVQEEEDINYIAADADRAKLLSHAIEIYNKRVDALSENIKKRIEPKKDDLKINYVSGVELGLDPNIVATAKPLAEMAKKKTPMKYAEVGENEGIDEEGVDREERIPSILLNLDTVIAKLNELANFIIDKRQKILEGILNPIDKVEASTEAYGEDAELQANLEIYLEAFESSIKDRREVLGIVDVSDENEKGLVGKRRANANAKAREEMMLANAIEVEKDQVIDTEQDVLRRQLKLERQALRITKKDRPFRKLISELKTESSRIPKHNVKAFKELQSRLHDVYDKQRDLTRTLNLEKDDFLGTFNSRVLYFKQLQILSDSVAPLDVERQEEGDRTILQEIAEADRIEVVASRNVQGGRAKLNYLHHIKNSSEDDASECAISIGETIQKRVRPQYNIIPSHEMFEIEEQKIFTQGHGVKIDTLCKHILTLRAQKVKSVVFSSWQSGMQIVERAFQKNDITYTLGSDVRKLEMFKKSDDVDVCLLNGERQSSGLNLTMASVVIFIDPIANFPLELQAIGRVDRMGQHQSVKVYTYASTDTIDEAILDLAALKGQSLYIKSQQNATLSTNDMESLEKAQTKGDFIAKKDDLLSLLLPDVHIPSFTPVADLASQMSDSAENVDANVDVKIED